jgi:hypothetical protein
MTSSSRLQRLQHDMPARSFWRELMVRDSKTRTGARAPEVERHASLAWRCSTEQVASDLERRTHAAAESTKDGCKPDPVTSMLGASLIEAGSGKALSDRPALEPYRGKPAVRNLRGIEETSASFEAWSAPRSHPTIYVAMTRAAEILAFTRSTLNGFASRIQKLLDHDVARAR